MILVEFIRFFQEYYMKFIKSLSLLISFTIVFSFNLLFAYPTSWWVNGNGYTGYLIYRVDSSTNKVKGKLLGTNVEGYLVGRHLVLHRYPQGNSQVWEGHIMDKRLGANIPSYNSDYFIAGTISVNGEQDYPWFAVENGKTAGIAGTNTINSGKVAYVGCFKDNSPRDLQGYSFQSDKMTNELCFQTCKSKGYKFAATQFANSCFCDNTYGKYGRAQKNGECNYRCKGNGNEMCGGYYRNSIYDVSGIQTNSGQNIGKLISGSYNVKQGRWKSVWRLNVSNGQITGTSEWACCPGHRIDKMTGYISGNSVFITRDCSGQGYQGKCKQIYQGEIKNNRINGTCSGTGIGVKDTWILFLN